MPKTHIHIHTGKTRDASPEVEHAYQAIRKAIKETEQLVIKLNNASERIKKGSISVPPEQSDEIAMSVRKLGYKVV